MSSKTFPPKDPDAVLDYKFDWAAETNGSGDTDWLDTDNTETITAGYTIEEETGIDVDSDARTDTNTSITIWLSGGTDGNDYDIICHIVTSAGREDDRTITIPVRER